MKPLRDYLNSLPVPEQKLLADRCGTTVNYLRQIGYGNRACSAELAIDLERESRGCLLCEALVPSGVDWAYIRATDPAPTTTGEPHEHQ